MIEVATKTASTVPETLIRLPQEGGSAAPAANVTSYFDEAIDGPLDVAALTGGIVTIDHILPPVRGVSFDSSKLPANMNIGDPWLSGGLTTIVGSKGAGFAFLVADKTSVSSSFVLLGAVEVVAGQDLRARHAHLRLEGTGYAKPRALTSKPETDASDAVSCLGSSDNTSVRDALVARFRLLRRLPQNHDNEGACAPEPKSVDAAIAFVSRMSTSTPCSATLNDEGQAVIEFEDRTSGFYADVTFLGGGRVEVYRRRPGKQSVLFEDRLDSEKTRRFLADEADVVF